MPCAELMKLDPRRTKKVFHLLLFRMGEHFLTEERCLNAYKSNTFVISKKHLKINIYKSLKNGGQGVLGSIDLLKQSLRIG